MDIRLIFAVLLIVTIESVYSHDVPCPTNACFTVRCGQPTCKENEVYVPKGGYCGCCDACYKYLSKYSKIYVFHIIVTFSNKNFPLLMTSRFDE